jgi:hypothetical protein
VAFPEKSAAPRKRTDNPAHLFMNDSEAIASPADSGRATFSKKGRLAWRP